MKKIIIFLTAIMCWSSCSDILDKEPLDMMTDAAVWNNETLIDAYLVQCYHDVPMGLEAAGYSWNGDGSFYGPVHYIHEVADEAKVLWDSDARGYEYKLGKLRIEGGLMDWWGYSAIRAINIFIERLPGSPLGEEAKRVKIAEARFLRAFAYFCIVKRYGGVPLITKAQKLDDPEEELYPARDKEEAVYDFIIGELDAIADDLPDAPETGRAGKYAALSLKSRAALYAGSIAQFGTVQLDGVVGIPSEKAAAYYQAAYDASDRIMKSGKFGLYSQNADKVVNFKNLFLTKNHNEAIFVKPHNNTSGIDGGHGWGWDFTQCPMPQAWNAGNKSAPYLEMVEEFEYIDGRPGTLNRATIQSGLWTTADLWKDKDPRFFASIWTHETPWKGGAVDFHNGLLLPNGTLLLSDTYNGVRAVGTQPLNWNQYAATSFGIMKYLDESHDNNTDPFYTSAADFQIFRYGEILLNYAEAAFELSKAGDALNAVNQIRTRAGIAPLASIDRDKIRHERKVELAFEGHRYWDVRRWRTATGDLSRDFSGLRYILDYNSYVAGAPKYRLQILEKVDGANLSPEFREENYYFPITLGRTSNNPKLKENPGYR